jgi:hypothetical protein
MSSKSAAFAADTMRVNVCVAGRRHVRVRVRVHVRVRVRVRDYCTSQQFRLPVIHVRWDVTEFFLGK